FFRAIKAQNLKIYYDYKPHVCPMCSKIPVVDKKLRDLLAMEIKPQDFERRKAKLQQERSALWLHESQLQVQRGEIERIKANLVDGQCLVLTDYAGHYTTPLSGKVRQLIFVIYY